MNGTITMSPKNSASFFSSTLISFLPCCRKENYWAQLHKKKQITEVWSSRFTRATKNRATTFDDFWEADIHVFLTAIRSAKWLPADRIPMKISTGSSGRGGACQLGNISRCFCGEKLGCVVGKDPANTDCTSRSPFNDKPVASSSTNPCQHHQRQKLTTVSNTTINISFHSPPPLHREVWATHSAVWKWCHMTSINIHMVTFQSSGECKNKQVVLHKWVWPINWDSLCAPNEPVQPPWRFWLLRPAFIIPNPLLTLHQPINCRTIQIKTKSLRQFNR